MSHNQFKLSQLTIGITLLVDGKPKTISNITKVTTKDPWEPAPLTHYEIHFTDGGIIGDTDRDDPKPYLTHYI